MEEGEELDGLLALQPEAILVRWFNYHLERVRESEGVIGRRDGRPPSMSLCII